MHEDLNINFICNSDLGVGANIINSSEILLLWEMLITEVVKWND